MDFKIKNKESDDYNKFIKYYKKMNLNRLLL